MFEARIFRGLAAGGRDRQAAGRGRHDGLQLAGGAGDAREGSIGVGVVELPRVVLGLAIALEDTRDEGPGRETEGVDRPEEQAPREAVAV